MLHIIYYNWSLYFDQIIYLLLFYWNKFIRALLFVEINYKGKTRSLNRRGNKCHFFFQERVCQCKFTSSNVLMCTIFSHLLLLQPETNLISFLFPFLYCLLLMVFCRLVYLYRGVENLFIVNCILFQFFYFIMSVHFNSIL